MIKRNKFQYINSFNTGTHFYLEVCVRLDHFIDISKCLWSSEDEWPQSSLF
ncbi:hypothetical protein E2C01_099728 [Portunus trituberculatus]|uniref:Uncharacterized protein n=1 Tax=Portunus trituberculatus TaxID=210409 RepID=A0A5B7KG41_PORTR|nr:hypothetical protein [Portunus trituberculatus]